MQPGHIKEANAIMCALTNLLVRLENDRANVTSEQYNDLRGKVVATGIEAIATMYGKQVASVTHDDDIITLNLRSTNMIGKELALLLAPHTNMENKHGYSLDVTVAAQLIKNMGMIVAEQHTNVY